MISYGKNLTAFCLLLLSSAALFSSCEIKVNEIEDKSGYDMNYEGKGGIAVTWDDCYVDDWYNARDLFKKYNARCTFFVSNFTSLDEARVKKLLQLQEDGHEIACHTFSHKDAVLYNMDYGMESYIEKEILPELDSMRSRGFNPEAFAYPFGSRNSETDEALLKYFRILRGTSYGNKGTLYSWGRTRILQGTGIDESYNVPIESIYSMLNEAGEGREVAVFYGHRITEDTLNVPAGTTTYKRLESILKKASDLGLTFFTASELDVRKTAAAYSRSIKAY